MTSLRSGRTWFTSPNWTTDLSLVQNVRSGPRDIVSFSGTTAFYFKGENVLEVEGKNKTTTYAVVENKWSCTSTPYYEFTVHYLMKH